MRRIESARGVPLLVCVLVLAGVACGGNGNKDRADAGPDVPPVDAGRGAVVDAAGREGGTPGSGGEAGSTSPDSGQMMVPVTSGEVDPNAPPNTGLPDLPRLVNVKASAIGDSVSISFDPNDSAVDYRVYALPASKDVSVAADGHVTIQNAVYRCAGNRQTPAATLDGAAQVPSGAIRTLVDGQNVDGYTRSLAEATLGFVYVEPGDGRVPVYALGDHDAKADNDCYFQRWTASRTKQYVTSSATRDSLLKQGFRDDGVVFYVPAAAGSTTRQISTSGGSTRYYFADGPEAAKRQGASAAFVVLKEQAKDTVPLMRVFYQNVCGASHDELVAGKARFEVARRQGDQLPVTKLHWSGLTGPTTLVVEALDNGCPFQGLLAPQSGAGYKSDFLGVTYQPLVTPEEVQSASPSHELFINGQFDGTNPKPIARSFVKISPAAAPALDWSFGYTASDDLGAFSMIDCGAADGNCFGNVRFKAASVEAIFYNTEDTRRAQRKLFGEWWVLYADLAADTNGKYRMTPNTKADLASDSFLYVSMDVDAFTTQRRYPQIIVSDRDSPVQLHLPEGNTLVFQTFADWPNTYELQICDHRTWDVNNQCPRYDFYRQRDPNNAGTVTGLAPSVEVGEQVGMDYSNRFEIYLSTKRAYLFLDGTPYGCANLPSAGVPKGAVTVTFGDVLYHSDADGLFSYTQKRRHNDAFRHFDNLGFKSHVGAPAWDEARFPCAPGVLNNN